MVNARGLRIRARTARAELLTLPWDTPLEEWVDGRLVEVARGPSRHVVRFVAMEGALYALKELPERLAHHEYDMLRMMADEGLPTVATVAVVDRQDLESVLVTAHLAYSLPYRTLFARQRRTDGALAPLATRLLDALAGLLVRLHLEGFYWGDCSLSNTLFRRDAGTLAAYLVDAETSERHPQLTVGQRRADLDLTAENVVGGPLDVGAELGIDVVEDPFGVADQIVARYEALWHELTVRVPLPAGQDPRPIVDERIRRLNALGFDAAEIAFSPAEGGHELLLEPVVLEAGHHRRRLFALTGLEAQENQARSLLNDLANWRAYQEHAERRGMPETVAAHRWMTEVVQPVIDAVPPELAGRREPVEVFHEVIEHKWYLSEAEGRDVGVEGGTRDYLDNVLPRSEPEEVLTGAEAIEEARGPTSEQEPSTDGG